MRARPLARVNMHPSERSRARTQCWRSHARARAAQAGPAAEAPVDRRLQRPGMPLAVHVPVHAPTHIRCTRPLQTH